MRFLMLVCRDESIPFSPEQRANVGPAVRAWVTEMQERRVRVDGDVLAPIVESTLVSVRDGDLHVERGPSEEVGVPASGFNILECADVNEAVEVSARHPIARFGVIELRPIVETT